MSAVVVDASVWISVLIASDANHSTSRSWMLQWVDDGNTFVLPLLILPEVAGGIARKTNSQAFGDAAAVSILSDPTITLVPLDQPLMTLAAQHAAGLPLRGADAVYTALAEHQGLTLVTWDSEQLTRAAGHINVLRPTI
ncbi:MAG TPA: type II toxin-antitoxin system VapC family toxin [Thermomicrobiales bacterium]|nr:type II toxin-antitoxin system VapC family toxin [Thermomicrobiales bacterium]